MNLFEQSLDQPVLTPMPQRPPVEPVLVCPACKVRVAGDCCREHGRVVPMRSAIFNRLPTEADWSAA